MYESTNVTPRNKDVSWNSIVYKKELGDFIFLILKLHNRQYRVQIREMKRNLFRREVIPTKMEFHEYC